MIEVRHYVNRAGIDVLAKWLAELADERATAKIADRIDRLSRGNFGDSKSLGGGLFELRVDAGPGYASITAMIGKTCVVLLCGGDKRKQSSDIQRAREYLKDYTERTHIQ